MVHHLTATGRTSLAILDHTVLPSTGHKWTRTALTPVMQAATRFTYPGGMEGWVDLVDLIAPRPGVEPATFRLRVRRRTTSPPRQPSRPSGVNTNSTICVKYRYTHKNFYIPDLLTKYNTWQWHTQIVYIPAWRWNSCSSFLTAGDLLQRQLFIIAWSVIRPRIRKGYWRKTLPRMQKV